MPALIPASTMDGMKSTGKVDIDFNMLPNISGKDVIIVEDIIDKGLTIDKMIRGLKSKDPASIEVAAILVKRLHDGVRFKPEYAGFEIPDAFVIGYGLDVNQKCREYKHIGVISEFAKMKYKV